MSACQLTAALLQSSKKERSDKTPKTILALSIALDSIQAGWFAKCRVKCKGAVDYLAQRSLGMINGIQTPRPGTLQSRLWLDGLVHSCLFPRPSPDFRRSRGSKFEPAGPICPQPEKRDSSGGGLHTERDLAAPHI